MGGGGGGGGGGGYFGGRLAAAGNDVTLIARGAHLAALRADGLRIESPKGDLHLPDIKATDDPAGVGPVDVVMFMVKNYDVEAAGEAIKPMLGPDTMVTTFQNGVSAPERLAAIVGADRVIPGVARIPADIKSPGVIRHNADFDILLFGESDGSRSQRCEQFASALKGAGTTAIIPENINHELWAKFVMQASLSSVTALTRLNLGPLRENAGSADLFQRSMVETAQVGHAIIAGLHPDIAAQQWKFLAGLPGTVHASMLDDLVRGKRIELDYLSGDVVRLGALHGVATPLHGPCQRKLGCEGQEGDLASWHDQTQPISVFQDQSRDHPPGSDVVHSFPAFVAQCGRPSA